MDAPVAIELGRAEPGDRAEHALLLRNAKPGLEPDEVPHLSGAILLSELHHSVGLASRARIG